jgi:hypothetical protein
MEILCFLKFVGGQISDILKLYDPLVYLPPHCDDCVVMFASMSGKCFVC